MTVFIVILVIGSSIVTTQFVMGLDGDTLKNLLGGCIYGACKDTKITGNVTDGILAGCVFGACKNVEITGESQQPTPNTATLIVKKFIVNCPEPCQFDASDFNIQVTGNNPSPSSFQGSDKGTTVTIGPGKYTVSETLPSGDNTFFLAKFAGDCQKDDDNPSATGNIKAGETQECTINNNI